MLSLFTESFIIAGCVFAAINLALVALKTGWRKQGGIGRLVTAVFYFGALGMFYGGALRLIWAAQGNWKNFGALWPYGWLSAWLWVSTFLFLVSLIMRSLSRFVHFQDLLDTAQFKLGAWMKQFGLLVALTLIVAGIIAVV